MVLHSVLGDWEAEHEVESAKKEAARSLPLLPLDFRYSLLPPREQAASEA